MNGLDFLGKFTSLVVLVSVSALLLWMLGDLFRRLSFTQIWKEFVLFLFVALFVYLVFACVVAPPLGLSSCIWVAVLALIIWCLFRPPGR
ncbi:MAG: hypothetical protein K2X27_18115 [Candidatus Obscuribacterales bacterium]|nr:hypothetical protein [Candidatus Obscuribacterales bacterium]